MPRAHAQARWNAIAAFSEECVAKLVHGVLLLYLVVSSALAKTLVILGLNFWHGSFLTTITVNHYPLFEF